MVGQCLTYALDLLIVKILNYKKWITWPSYHKNDDLV